MKLAVLGLWWLVPALVAAWSAIDLEIFRLKDGVSKDIGENETFYSWLGVPSKASSAEVNRAYRKLSRALHPDRNPGVAGATERFQRLNAIHKLLRSPDRERYDFYLAKGFPQLTSANDYIFRRYRPNVIVAVLLMVILATAVQYVALKASATRKRQFVQDIVDQAKNEAKDRHTGIQTVPEKLVDVNGKRFLVEVTGAVSLIDPAGGGRLQVSTSDIPEPTLRDTLVGKLVSKFLPPGASTRPSTTSSATTTPSIKVQGPNGDEPRQAGDKAKTTATRRRPASARKSKA